ncbi:zinc metalloprotease [Actinomadura fulvescens]|uniref:Zinc metalloprotease n=1 Tax=Actinomadura fulvescens TaxID=46160 RepID=A0ABP6D2Q2_9ACTN
MKLLVAAAVLVAASISPMSTPIAPARAAPEPAGSTTGTPSGCARPDARIRPGAHGARERNELTPAEAVDVERELNGLLAALGTKAPAAGASGAKASGTGQQRRQASIRRWIPVYFHVLHDGSRGNLPTALIKRQIATMNAAYGGGLGGADTGFRFALRRITRSDNADWYRYPETYENTYKPRLRRGGPGTLNLYSADLGDELLGWSTFPWLYKNEPKLDGVVLHIGSMPGGSIDNFNRGFSGVHETGHWLGLYHVFQDGCASPGDRVPDTPPARESTDGCPDGKDTCAAAGRDPVHNFMDYSFDACMNNFTAGQGVRMHKVWSAYRG